MIEKIKILVPVTVEEFRHFTGMTQFKFADEVGITRAAYKGKAQGIRPFTKEDVYLISQRFGVDMDRFTDYKEE